MSITARDIMSHPVISIPQDSSVRQLLGLLHNSRISGVPVVSHTGLLRGVISLTDLLSIEPETPGANLRDASDFHTSPAMDGLSQASELFQPAEAVLDLPIRALMSPLAITTTEGASIGSIADLMASRRIHRVIVVRGEEPVGIISLMDILRALRDQESLLSAPCPGP